MKAGLLSLTEQPEGDRILGITYEGDLRGTEDEKGDIVPLCLTWEDIQNLKTDFFRLVRVINFFTFVYPEVNVFNTFFI